jgi:diguanylate cyclase (GGDEF)-like protein
MHTASQGERAHSGFVTPGQWRARNEMAQARLRIWGGLAFMLGMGVLQWGAGYGPFDKALPLLCVYLLGSLAWAGVVARGWGRLRVRLMLAATLEHLMYGYAMYAGGQQSALLLGVPMFTSLGNGLRYGPGMACFNAVLALVCLQIGFQASLFWSAMPELTLGVCLATTCLPVYGAILNRRLQSDRQAAEQRAVAWEQASKTDPLTGLANRIALMEAMEGVFGTQRHAARVCALFYIDLDGFKAVNDQAGHTAGDQVLVDVAQALRGAVRENDVIARIGGDEFCILTHGLARAQDARAVADKVLRALDTILVPGHEGLRIGASIGVCLLPADHIATPQDAVQAADALMLAVKREGKGALRMHVPGEALRKQA